MKEWHAPLKHNDPPCGGDKGCGTKYPIPKKTNSVPPKGK